MDTKVIHAEEPAVRQDSWVFFLFTVVFSVPFVQKMKATVTRLVHDAKSNHGLMLTSKHACSWSRNCGCCASLPFTLLLQDPEVSHGLTEHNV